MSDKELLPCPFCGAGQTLLRPETFWTGMSNKLVSVTVQHWCEKEDGNLQSVLQVKRKTQEEAIAAWNTRVSTPTCNQKLTEKMIAAALPQLMREDEDKYRALGQLICVWDALIDAAKEEQRNDNESMD